MLAHGAIDQLRAMGLTASQLKSLGSHVNNLAIVIDADAVNGEPLFYIITVGDDDDLNQTRRMIE